MSTKSRNILPEYFYHVYNRGTNKNTLFYTKNDYDYFLSKALFYKEKYKIKILAYSILPNHWHFLIQEPKKTTPGVKINHLASNSSITAFFCLLSNSYTKFFNMNKNQSGRIFQGPFKSKLVDNDNYLKTLIKYINLNHVKHKITKKADDWLYTSHHDYLNLANYNLVDQDYLIDFKDYKDLVNHYNKDLKNMKEEFDPWG